MAANIEIRNIDGKDVASYIENGKEGIAWHKLGTVYDRPLTAIEALEGSHADFNVSLQPIATLTPAIMQAIEEGSFINASTLKDLVVKDRKATMRNDVNETLGIVSEKYGIVQNRDAFNFIDILTTGQLGGEIPTIESAGVLGRGERIFITAKFPEAIRMENNNNDLIDMYVVFTTSHDGTGAVTCMITPIRVVCNNTLNLAFSNNSGKLSLRHSLNINNRLDLSNKENAKMAYSALNLYNLYKQEFESNLNKLSSIKLSDAQIKNILAESILSKDNFNSYKLNDYNINSKDISTRSKNIFSNMMDSIESGVGQNVGTKGTAMWLINGMTSFYQNVAEYKNDERKFDSITNGNVANTVQNALNIIERNVA